MKKIYIVITLLLITFNSIAFAQFKDWGSKFGVRYNQIFPENEFRNVGFGGNDDLSFKSYHFSFPPIFFTKKPQEIINIISLYDIVYWTN